MNIKTLVAASAMAAGLALAGASAHASTNLVANGSFETGDFTDWAQFGNTGFTGVSGSFSGVNPTDGADQAYFGPVGSTGGIDQDVATQAGAHFVFSFDVFNFGGTPSYFDAAFGATHVLTLVDPGPFGYTHESFSVLATGPLTNVAFTTQQNPSYFLLDNVSVSAPEPATWALMIGGFGLAGASLRRRTRALA
jgi:hypothetical protein